MSAAHFSFTPVFVDFLCVWCNSHCKICIIIITIIIIIIS